MRLAWDREEQSHEGCFWGILGVKDGHICPEVRISKKQSPVMVMSKGSYQSHFYIAFWQCLAFVS